MYIGKTEANSCNKRWKQHIADSQNPSRSNYDYPLYRAFRKYGLENFSFEEIEWLKPCVEKIDQTEIRFNDGIQKLSDAQKSSISKYIYRIWYR